MMHANKQQNHARRRFSLLLALVGLLSVTGLVKGPTTPASAQADAPRWSYTGSLNTAHSNHSATLLANGKVLVVEASSAPSTSAELYDPSTGTWSLTGSLNTARSAHTATLLSDGKVLVVGGHDGIGHLRSAELYDPDAPIPVPRIISASVSGKKLIVTGENFDPGAVILLNGEEQKTKNNQNQKTRLVAKKAGKLVKTGDRVQVRNPNGTLSEGFIFTGL